jgi:hypothetical protein
MNNSNGSSNAPLTNAVLSGITDVATKAAVRGYVQRFIHRGEINEDRFTPQIREAMVDFLIDRGVQFTNTTDVEIGLFDEHFVAAYENAISFVVGSVDPVDAARRTPSAATATWQFDVDTFDELDLQGIIKENIRAAGAIDYVYELGERLGVFRIVDALVLNWSSGAIDVADGLAAQRLYRYLRLRDERSTPEERGMMYKRVLAKGNTKVLERMVTNENFPRLWNSLMNEVARYIDKTERVTEGTSERSPVSRSGIFQATRELQYNLTEHCTGMAHMQVRELYAQLQQCFEILKDEEVIAHFGGSRRKSMWTVIEYLSRQEFGEAPNIGAFRRLAVEGNTVFAWIAEFNDAPTQDQFARFLEAAEAYILAGSVVGDGFEMEDAGTEEEAEDEFAAVEDSFEDDF